MMNWNEVLTIALVATSGMLVLGTAIAWRRMIRQNPGLPIWHFLLREGITRDDAADILIGKAVMQAELSCAVCGNTEECRARLAARNAAVPPANCPNARFFDEFGLRPQAGKITSARLSQKPNSALDFTNTTRSKGPKPAL